MRIKNNTDINKNFNIQKTLFSNETVHGLVFFQNDLFQSVFSCEIHNVCGIKRDYFVINCFYFLSLSHQTGGPVGKTNLHARVMKYILHAHITRN